MILPFDIGNFKAYYRGQFTHDLANFLNNFRLGQRETYHCRNGFPFVPAAESTNLSYVVSDTDEHIGYFGVAMFYTLAFVNVLYEASRRGKGLQLAKRFCKLTGWPTFSSGMGGPMRPAYTLYDLYLMPMAPAANENYRENVLKAYDFMMQEWDLFASGNQRELTGNPEYESLLADIKEYAYDFKDSVRSKINWDLEKDANHSRIRYIKL